MRSLSPAEATCILLLWLLGVAIQSVGTTVTIGAGGVIRYAAGLVAMVNVTIAVWRRAARTVNPEVGV